MTTLEYTKQQGINYIGREVLSSLEKKLSCQFSITQYESLIQKNEFWVGRLCLQAEGSQPLENATSIVVKHIPPDSYPITKPLPYAFRNEVAAYRFLQQLDQFDCFPKVYADQPGVLAMENLKLTEKAGAGGRDYLTKLTRTLASLHVNSADQIEPYQKIQAALALDISQGVVYPSSDQWFGCLEGLKIWREWGALFDCGFSWLGLIDTLSESISNPGPFLSFIHTELASTRNTVFCEKGVFLLDFESSGFGHALLDIAIPMVGQIHWSRKKNGYFLRHLNADMAFAEHHRQQWMALGGQPIAAADWYNQLALMLVFTAALATASAHRAEQRVDGASPLSSIFIDILSRLNKNLESISKLAATAPNKRATNTLQLKKVIDVILVNLTCLSDFPRNRQ